MIQAPQNQQWEQVNSSDLFGSIFVSKNLNFDEAGYVKNSYGVKAVLTEESEANLGIIKAIIKGDDYNYFIGTSDEAFELDNNILRVAPAEIADSGVTSTGIRGDAKYIGGQLVVSSNSDVDYYDDGTNAWTDTNISTTSTLEHPIESFVSLSALAIANGNTVRLYTSPLTATPTLLRTLTIPADFEITALKYWNQNLYIATKNENGGKAFMFVWNGLGSAAQSAYELDSNIMLNLSVYANSIIGLSGSGAILRFEGSGFSILAAFPIFYTDLNISTSSSVQIFTNSIESNTDVFYILFTSDANHGSIDGADLNMPDGLWCYDPSVGLYHRYSFSNSLALYDSFTTGDVNTTTNEIAVTSAPVTGTEVLFNQTFGLAPLVNGEKYYVIRVDATTIKLAETLTDAQDGNAIDLTSVSGTNSFTFLPKTDFGQFFTDRTTAMSIIKEPTSNRRYGTDVLFGADVPGRDNSSDNTVCVPSYGTESRSYLVTPKITSSEVTSNYNSLTLKFRPLIEDTQKIIIKYRTEDDQMDAIRLSDWDITWTSSTTFTTTQEKWSEAKEAFDLTNGKQKKYEVEILTGGGAGILAHIENITESSGTYTVTIDEEYTDYQSGDAGSAVFRNFIKFKEITKDTELADKGLFEEQLGAAGKFLQLKVELRGAKQVSLQDILVDDVYRLSAFNK